MSLKLMYITNRVEVAQIAEESGVDIIFVDMEYIGKAKRQGGMDTVQSHHTLEDIKTIANAVHHAEVLVRINPIHEATDEYISSREEIETAVQNNADIVMLPYFKTIREVKDFLDFVNGKAQTMLLLETPEAVAILDDILKLDGIDIIHIGLNDLSLGYKRKFMFELLTDGIVEELSLKCRHAKVAFGIGGIAALGKGTVPAEMVIRELYRLGAQYTILSRSFCNTAQIVDLNEIRSIFVHGIQEIRALETECQQCMEYFWRNRSELEFAVRQFTEQCAR